MEAAGTSAVAKEVQYNITVGKNLVVKIKEFIQLDTTAIKLVNIESKVDFMVNFDPFFKD